MLKINMEFRKGILFIRLKGVLNKETSIGLTKKVNDLITEIGIKFIVFNLQDLKKISKEGIDTINENYIKISIFNGKLIICGVKSDFEEKIYYKIEQLSDELQVLKLIHV